ncbi:MULTISPECIES: Imm42 family immunity protein [Xanthomonas]|uniref:Imm42 family immunity protein n=1 Tax=Xanthomonas TaxID=338 RepID=UPI0009EC4600|nr:MULTISPECIES: Imm42 family immunity protein [Xanthomonas]
MIFGNPHKFAILAAPVSKWTDPESYVNGIFHFIIDGEIFPEKLRVATLGGDAVCFDFNHPLIAFPENERIFHSSSLDAFNEMMELALPQNLNEAEEYPESDEKYKASTFNLEDGGAYVFSVSYRDQVRLVGAQVSRQKLDSAGVLQWEDLLPLVIYEAYLTKNEISEVVNGFLSSVE